MNTTPAATWQILPACADPTPMEAAAEALGITAGKDAATWAEPGDAATSAHVLTGIEDGDPEVLDAYTVPTVHDGPGMDPDYTITELADELGIDPEGPDAVATLEAMAEIWEAAAQAAYFGHLEGVAAAMVYPEGTA
jgi:hypothetical protein